MTNWVCPHCGQAMFSAWDSIDRDAFFRLARENLK